jgi:hypothetical protein
VPEFGVFLQENKKSQHPGKGVPVGECTYGESSSLICKLIPPWRKNDKTGKDEMNLDLP